VRLLSPGKESLHPNLRAHGYRVTSEETAPSTVKYNCVAWAATADRKNWWQAGNEPGYFWPNGVRDDGSFQSYVELFEWLGYRECNNRRIEIGYEKIALYAHPDGDFSHVSYQLFYGWTSKLGDWEDIRHRTLEALEDDDYGTVRVLMKRRSGPRGFLARLFFVLTSQLWRLKPESVST
jgi:hypothetical protein